MAISTKSLPTSCFALLNIGSSLSCIRDRMKSKAVWFSSLLDSNQGRAEVY